MEEGKFTCKTCGATDKTLTVHHINYRKGAEPWEYDANQLCCLCEPCHEEIERKVIPAMRLLAVEANPSLLVDVVRVLTMAVLGKHAIGEVPTHAIDILPDASAIAKSEWILGFLEVTGSLRGDLDTGHRMRLLEEIQYRL